jgi:hypothetical protein
MVVYACKSQHREMEARSLCDRAQSGLHSEFKDLPCSDRGKGQGEDRSSRKRCLCLPGMMEKVSCMKDISLNYIVKPCLKISKTEDVTSGSALA